MKVGYLGPIGSFTYSATLAAFPDATLIPYASIPACLKAIEQQEVTCSIIPIENTIEGTVNASIDYLYHQAQLPVQAELVLPIQQQLMVAKENQSRFWVLGSENLAISFPLSEKKITLAITMPSNVPGSLHKALSVFSWRGINLSKIESRPLKTKLGEYFFLMDLVNDQPEKLIEAALTELELIGAEIKILGDYPIYVLSTL